MDSSIQKISSFQPYLLSNKEQNTSSLQLEATECLCAVHQIQNGRSGVTSFYPTGERLHDEIGPQRCLLLNSNNERAQEVSALHIRQCNIRIPMPTVRTLISSTDIHQSPETSGCIAEETRTTCDHLPRRSIVGASGHKGTNAIVQQSMSTAQRSGIHHQEGKVLNNSPPISCFSRCFSELGEHDNGSTCNKTAGPAMRSPVNEGENSVYHTQMSKIGVATAPLHYRALQQLHIKSLHKYGILARKKHITLTSEALADLQWWTSPKPMQENSSPIVEPMYNVTIQTDASCLGWGAVCQGTRTGGHWSKDEQQAHINVLELKAAHLAIQST